MKDKLIVFFEVVMTILINNYICIAIDGWLDVDIWLVSCPRDVGPTQSQRWPNVRLLLANRR